jgi:hypothetical protein
LVGRRGNTFGAADWNSSAAAFRGNNGSKYFFACPAGGTIGPVWGTEVYTDDSRACSAGVHRGLLGTTAGREVLDGLETCACHRQAHDHDDADDALLRQQAEPGLLPLPASRNLVAAAPR